jgi:hypothetical protein
MSTDDSPTLGSVLRDWAAKLVPVILIWGITSEVRVQMLTANVARLETEMTTRSASILRTQELVTKNTILLETQTKKIDNLEKDIRELLRLLTNNRPRRRNNP